MRRSILIVMLDVMVLSVLALTARNRAGGETDNIPLPSSSMVRMVEEGLRNDASYRNEIARLESQLKESAEVTLQALEQVRVAQAEAERARSGSAETREKLREAELEAERAQARARLAARETELINEQTVQVREQMTELELREAAARQRARELELREVEAKARAAAALTRVQLAEEQARKAERQAKDAELNAGDKDVQIRAMKEEVLMARASREQAEQRVKELSGALATRETELIAVRSEKAEAQAKAMVAVAERERLAEKNDRVVEKMVEARETAAVAEARKQGADEKVAVLEEEKKSIMEDQAKSVWVRRDEALRRVMISFTEYNGAHDRSYRTDKTVAMPLVQMGNFVFIPAEFKALGLSRSFFGGISDQVTDVRGVLAPMVSGAMHGSLNAVIVPGIEPQVCLVHSMGKTDGALESITMQGVKAQRLRSALLFSPHDVNAYGQVDISPVLGRDYLNVRPLSGKKPKAGDYLLTERGQFIGVMVEKDVCYVLPSKVADQPKPVVIPLKHRGKEDVYLKDFIGKLNEARKLLERQHARNF